MMKNSFSHVALMLCPVLLQASVTFADERDDALFGEEAPTATPQQKETQSSELPKTPPPVLADTDIPYTLGGRIQLELNGQGRTQSKAKDSKLSASQQLDVFLDTRSERWRYFVKGTLDRNSGTGETAFETREFWLKWDNQQVFVTIGQQPLKWGASRIWNPTDFLAVQSKDPFATEDRRLGLWLAKVHYPLESIGANLYFLLDGNRVSQNSDLGAALRSEWVVGPAEWTLTAAQKYKQGLKLGTDISLGVGPFDVQWETALLNKPSEKVFEGEVNPAQGKLPQAKKQPKQSVQMVGGVEYGIKYSDEDAIYFGYEFFWNSLGQSNFELETYAFISGSARPFYLGKRYHAGYMRLPNPGNWNSFSSIATVVHNQTDKTGIARLNLDWSITPRVSFGTFWGRYYGKKGEFRFQLPESFYPLAEGPKAPISKERLEVLKQRPLLWVAGLTGAMKF
jgi:hypothetical protein